MCKTSFLFMSTMSGDRDDRLDLLHDVIPFFLRALPRKPHRRPWDGALDPHHVKTNNATTSIREDMLGLNQVIYSSLAAIDVTDRDKVDRFSDALNALLACLNRLVDETIPSIHHPNQWPALSYMRSIQHGKTIKQSRDSAQPKSAYRRPIIRYPIQDSAALKEIKYIFNRFKSDVDEVYDDEVYHPSIIGTNAQPQDSQLPDQFGQESSYARELAKANRISIEKHSESVTALMDFLRNPCSPAHKAHVHLSGFGGSGIDTIISKCGASGAQSDDDDDEPRKWRFVRWNNASLLASSSINLGPNEKSLCERLRSPRGTRNGLCMQPRNDGTRSCVLTGPMKRAEAPKKALHRWLSESWAENEQIGQESEWPSDIYVSICLQLVRSFFCLLPTPLVHARWDSQNILVDDAEETNDTECPVVKAYIMGDLDHHRLVQDSAKSGLNTLYLAEIIWILVNRKPVSIIDIDDAENAHEALYQALYNSVDKWPGRFGMSSIRKCLDLYCYEVELDEQFNKEFFSQVLMPLTKGKIAAQGNRRPVPQISKEVAISSPQDDIDMAARLSCGEMPTSLFFKRKRQPSFPPDDSFSNIPVEEVTNSLSFKRTRQTRVLPLEDSFLNLFIEGNNDRPDEKLRDYAKDFTGRMDSFKMEYILSGSGPNPNIPIVILDTGISINGSDMVLEGGRSRIIERKNFLNDGNDECEDEYEHGHGTHVARILLRLVPDASIIMAKVCKSRTTSSVDPIIQALTWIDSDECNAKIIVIPFGIVSSRKQEVENLINKLLRKNKFVFAAASNSGGNEPRAFPASQTGVFAVHVADGCGNPGPSNPPNVDRKGSTNFSTLGLVIDSKWKGKEVFVSGSSFATPVAAAIAANVLVFVQRELKNPDDYPDYFSTLQGMESLFHCMSDKMGDFHYVRPWARHLWRNHRKPEAICDALRDLVLFGHEKWTEMAKSTSFKGFDAG